MDNISDIQDISRLFEEPLEQRRNLFFPYDDISYLGSFHCGEKWIKFCQLSYNLLETCFLCQLLVEHCSYKAKGIQAAECGFAQS